MVKKYKTVTNKNYFNTEFTLVYTLKKLNQKLQAEIKEVTTLTVRNCQLCDTMKASLLRFANKMYHRLPSLCKNIVFLTD